MSTTVLDIILNTPLKLLSSNATKEEFFSCTNLSDQLKIAYDVLNPYYSMNLESCWPRTYRQVSFGIKIETQNCFNFVQKDDEKSVKYRTAGNSMFSKSKLRESLRLYTEAILWATPASEDLAMAFANRSAAHFDNGNFVAANRGVYFAYFYILDYMDISQ